MRTGDLARLLGVSASSIQNWAREFEEYLPEQKGKQRRYTDQDLILMATIAKLSADGYQYNAIRERLNEGYRVDSPSEANFGVDTRMVPAAAVEQIIDSTELKVELEHIKAERDKLSDLLQKAEQRAEDWQQKYEMLQSKISELERALGRAEGRLEELDRRRDNPEK